MSDEQESRTTPIWLPRLTVLVALAATAWFAGPKAFAVLARQMKGTDEALPKLDLTHIGVREVPDWLRAKNARPILERVLLDLEPLLRGEVAPSDHEGLDTLKTQLAACPWIAVARFSSLPESGPDVIPRLGVELDLRRPEIAVVANDGKIRHLIAADGVVLPGPVRALDPRALPIVVAGGAVDAARFRNGRVCREPYVLAAVAVAHEWRTLVVPAVEEAGVSEEAGASEDAGAAQERVALTVPTLLEIDASNLGGEFLRDPRYSQVAIALESADRVAVPEAPQADGAASSPSGGARGMRCWMQYGCAEAAGGAIPAETKAEVLAEVLALAPGLTGLAGGDLRLRNRWRDCLVMRAPSSPGRSPEGR